jgi:hypothetical protein
VITDMVLPGRTGQQLGQDLREHSPELAVLVTSGYSNPEHEMAAPESSTYFLANAGGKDREDSRAVPARPGRKASGLSFQCIRSALWMFPCVRCVPCG